uniref:Disulfide-rich peptide n=1 Tax=Siphoviridae sp. ct6bU4 TaxID=2825344 RepID=A0A8S5VAD7_9CAUD|nr:MAG TPA: disulfide-rich peptide [Siphoviridae sp. ct6bU4]
MSFITSRFVTRDSSIQVWYSWFIGFLPGTCSGNQLLERSLRMAVEKVLPQVHVRASDVHLDLMHYQFRVLETALPPARSLRYQVPALLSEMGELYGVLAKEVRDAKGAPNYPARQAELGDVAYLTALTLNDLGVKAISPSYERKVSEIGLTTLFRSCGGSVLPWRGVWPGSGGVYEVSCA